MWKFLINTSMQCMYVCVCEKSAMEKNLLVKLIDSLEKLNMGLAHKWFQQIEYA